MHGPEVGLSTYIDKIQVGCVLDFETVLLIAGNFVWVDPNLRIESFIKVNKFQTCIPYLFAEPHTANCTTYYKLLCICDKLF